MIEYGSHQRGSDELEKQFRIKTVERFSGKKGDLSRPVEEVVKTWISKKE